MLEEVKNTINTYVYNNWGETPIQFENTTVKFSDSSEAEPLEVPYIQCSIFVSNVVPSSIGTNGTSKMLGYVRVDVFGEKDVGTGEVDRLVSEIETLFAKGTILDRFESDRKIFFTAPVPYSGIVTDVGLYMNSVECRFYTFF